MNFCNLGIAVIKNEAQAVQKLTKELEQTLRKPVNCCSIVRGELLLLAWENQVILAIK